MIIQYASDLHMEHPANRKFLNNYPLRPVAETLILAGDILPLKDIHLHRDFIQFLSDHWKTVLWIPGNHEFYGMDINKSRINGTEKIKENVFLCNHSIVEIEDISFIAATLWSKISTINEHIIKRLLNDFNHIYINGDRLTVEDFNKLHADDKYFLKSKFNDLKSKDKKFVAVTHHVPTLKNYPSEYYNSTLNDAFVSNFASSVRDTLPSYWIYGHHHRNVPNFKTNNCYFITNQLGYVQTNEHQRFKLSLTFKV